MSEKFSAPSGVLNVYIAPMPENIEIQPLACEARNAEIESTGSEKLRRARFFDWQVLMFAAEHALGIDAEKLGFTKNAQGKWECGKFFFSFSHTEGAVAVAVSDGRVGVDMENLPEFYKKPCSEGEARSRLFKKICTPREAEAENEENILDLWLKKESIFKCCGDKASAFAEETGDYNTLVCSFECCPEYRLALCGDEIKNAKFYLYKNGTARMVKNCCKRADCVV